MTLYAPARGAGDLAVKHTGVVGTVHDDVGWVPRPNGDAHPAEAIRSEDEG